MAVTPVIDHGQELAIAPRSVFTMQNRTDVCIEFVSAPKRLIFSAFRGNRGIQPT
jgi:hypothetical protein